MGIQQLRRWNDHIIQRTSRHGEIPPEMPEFKLGENVPESWRGNDGEVDLTLSHSPWLSKLLGLPEILDYLCEESELLLLAGDPWARESSPA